ncbi:MAG: HlyC/CorC family transporter [Chloroflexaceae bacterium]|nr:HlyC/CorC family transporter [Chloroflexaceae bacterium]
MDPESGLIAIGIGLCLLVLAYISTVSAILTAIGYHRLNVLLHQQTIRDRRLAHLHRDPSSLRATIVLIGAALVIMLTLFTLHIARSFGQGWQVGSLLLLLLAVLLMTEALPRLWLLRNPEATMLVMVKQLGLLSRLLLPLIKLAHLLVAPLVRSGQPDHPSAPPITEAELRLLVNAGEKEGLIEHDEREMIEGIFSFGDTIIREIMVPRVDIVALEDDTPLEDAVTTIMEEGHSRIPVYHETVDEVVGMLYAKDLLPALRDGYHDIPITAMLRPVYFVPETMKVDDLFRELQRSKVHLAIVVDEYGSTAGLATIEDLIEQIFGEIQDEYDVEEPSVQVISETEIITHVRVPIDDINELTGLDLQSTEADRIGGLVYEQLGRLPKLHDHIVVNGAVITVVAMTGVRPQKLHIIYHLESEDDQHIRQGEDHLLRELLNETNHTEPTQVPADSH